MGNSDPIAVFDSGLGGLTVVKALQKTLPAEAIIYFGDSARVPYGNKSKTLIREYSREITEFLINKKAKMIVVACNTASALALENLTSEFEIPLLGVIGPGVEAALKATGNDRVGIIGTIATIRSGAYEKTLKALSPELNVFSKSCPLFVPLVEEGWLNGSVPDLVAAAYLREMNAQNVDTIILGCTHYPLLKPVLQKVVNKDTFLIDSADTTALKTAEMLKKLGILNNSSKPGSFTCFVTDLPLRFKVLARRFLGTSIDHVSTVHLT
ncbi:MAG: glutamate racemase [Candidatus Neomarinimicrobiota bacterium]